VRGLLRSWARALHLLGFVPDVLTFRYRSAAMQLSIPSFQFRFMKAQGNVIFPGNFHPVNAQRGSELAVQRAVAGGVGKAGSAGSWLFVGGSGGFGSAARIAFGTRLGAHSLNLSFDPAPQPESGNKIRRIGSPGWHRNRAIERELRARGRVAESLDGDAFDPAMRAATIDAIRTRLPGGKLSGLVWALAAPRGLDPRTGQVVGSSLKPLGKEAVIRTFTGADDGGPFVDELTLQPGSPDEAIKTQFVMGGRIVEIWIDALLEAGVLAEGFTLLTISYRGSPLNEAIYHKGLIGLAKADLEFTTRALDGVLARRVGGRAYAVEGPAVVTEASGGIPGVPFYMALLLDVMGDAHEDPTASMLRMVDEHFAPGRTPKVDEDALVRMDERELAPAIQDELRRRYEALPTGTSFPRAWYDRFMAAYARTRGFELDGVDYAAEFDTDDVCR